MQLGTRYERTWRNTWPTLTATTIGEMIECLREAAEELDEMEEAGVVLEHNGGMGDDSARLTTTDRRVAKTFGFKLRTRAMSERDGGAL